MKIDQKIKEMGAELLTLRKQKKLSQIEAAKLAGLHASQIPDIEKGRTDFTLKSYLKYRAIFDESRA